MQGTKWIKGTRCEGGSCVEVARRDGWIGVRNSQVPSETVWFTAHEWAAFVAGVRGGEFDGEAHQ